MTPICARNVSLPQWQEITNLLTSNLLVIFHVFILLLWHNMQENLKDQLKLIWFDSFDRFFLFDFLQDQKQFNITFEIPKLTWLTLNFTFPRPAMCCYWCSTWCWCCGWYKLTVEIKKAFLLQAFVTLCILFTCYKMCVFNILVTSSFNLNWSPSMQISRVKSWCNPIFGYIHYLTKVYFLFNCANVVI